MKLQINPEHDPEALRVTLLEKGRLQIPNFLTEGVAESLYQLLHSNKPWYATYNHGDEHVESPVEDIVRLSPQHRQQFMMRINQGARSGFQYLFHQYAISSAIKNGEDSGHPLHFMHDEVNSEHFLSFMRILVGNAAIDRSDSYASQYLPGHFLTAHDDKHAHEARVAAYTISLTKGWQPDWGGHLIFLDEKGNIEEGFKPAFNTLNIFMVPKMHAVQHIAPFAGAPRQSFLGWLKTR